MKLTKILISISILILTTSCKQELVIKKLGSCYIQKGDEIMYLKKNDTGAIDTISLEFANAKLFEIISDKTEKTDCINTDVWAKDKLSVWYKENKINGADPNTFKVIKDKYASDKNSIYYKNIAINKKSNDFKVLGNFYAKNNEKIWYKGLVVKGVENISDFSLIDSYFSTDKISIYLNSDTLLLKIPDSDAKSFVLANENNSHLNSLKYYKDKDKIYCIDTEKNIGEPDFMSIFLAFTDSFEVLAEKYYTKDNFNIYFKNKPIEDVDLKTFKILGYNYSKDSLSIYFRNKIMYGINYKLFKVFKTDTTDAQDSLNYFLQGKRISKTL